MLLNRPLAGHQQHHHEEDKRMNFMYYEGEIKVPGTG